MKYLRVVRVLIYWNSMVEVAWLIDPGVETSEVETSEVETSANSTVVILGLHQGQTEHGMLRVLTVSTASALSQVEQFLQAALTQYNFFHIFTASRPSTAHLHQYPAARAIALSTETESTHWISRWLKNRYKSRRGSLQKSIPRPQMASPLESAASNVSFMLEQNARLITTIGALSAISIVVAPILGQNYRAYIDAGPGGLSPNVYGWAKSSFLKIFLSCDTTNTDVYLGDPNKDAWLDPSEVTKRSGERPTFNWHPVPSRQITQRADAMMNDVSPVYITRHTARD